MLLGLSAFDFNLYIRGDELERRSDVIDWSMYLRDGNVTRSATGACALLALRGSAASSTDPVPRPPSLFPPLGLRPPCSSADSAAEAVPATSAAGALRRASTGMDGGAADLTGAGDGPEAAPVPESAADQLARRLKTALDQRSYVEEVLRTTERKLADTQERLEGLAVSQRQTEDQLRTWSFREGRLPAAAARGGERGNERLRQGGLWLARVCRARGMCAALCRATNGAAGGGGKGPASDRPRAGQHPHGLLHGRGASQTRAGCGAANRARHQGRCTRR